MKAHRVRALSSLAAVILGVAVAAGCGGSGGATTTTAAVPDGVVTIQTDTVLRDTTTAPTPTSGAQTAPGDTGDAQFDALVTALTAATRGTLADIAGKDNAADATALVQAITSRTEQFDRAVDSITRAVVSGKTATDLRAAIVAAAPAASDAYREFADSAVQAADSNNAASLQAAEDALTTALATFGAAIARA